MTVTKCGGTRLNSCGSNMKCLIFYIYLAINIK